MKTNPKFTATLVHEADKATVVAMRTETGLSEKDLMGLIITAAAKQKAAIVTEGKRIVAAQKEEAEKTRKANYENLKTKMQQARAEARAEKDAAAAKSAKATPAKAAGTKVGVTA